MAVSCDPSSLAAAARCFSSCNQKMNEAIKTSLLCQYASGPVTPPPAVPLTIDIQTGSVVNNTTVIWTNSDVPTTNEIWKSTDGGATFALYSSVAGGVHSFNDVAVQGNNTVWYYKVRACNGASCSAFTDFRGVSNNWTATSINLPNLVFAYGNLTLPNQAGAVSLPLLRKSFGNITGTGGMGSITTVDFPVLATSGGTINFAGSSATSFSFPLLTTSVNIQLNTCANLTTVNLNSLQTVVGLLFLYGPSLQTTVSLPALTSVGSSLSVDSTPGLTTFNIPVLATCGDLSVASENSLVTLSAPALTHLTGNLFSQGSNISNVSFPLLTQIDQSANFDSCNNIGTLSMNAVVTISGTLQVTNCANVFFVQLLNLVTTSGGIDCSNSPGLSAWSAPNLVCDDGQNYSWNADGLTDTSIAEIVDRAANHSATTTSTYDFSGGANTGFGSLSPTAEADIGTLIGAGNTVFTNP